MKKRHPSAKRSKIEKVVLSSYADRCVYTRKENKIKETPTNSQTLSVSPPPLSPHLPPSFFS